VCAKEFLRALSDAEGAALTAFPPFAIPIGSSSGRLDFASRTPEAQKKMPDFVIFFF
jgi:hypothetical protein